MKSWIVAIALVVVLGFTGFADAKGAGKGKKEKAVHGTISQISGNTIMLTVGKKNNTSTVTVTVDGSTTYTIDGKPGNLASLSTGQKVTVVGTPTASKITVGGKHHKKKAA